MSHWQEQYPYRGNRKKKKRKRFRRFLKLTAGVIVSVFFLINAVNFAGEHFVLTEDGLAWSDDAGMPGGGRGEYVTGADARRRLEKMAEDNEKVRTILDNADQYPEDLLELLANNEETADFVLDYPQKKDLAPAESIGDMSGGIPLLLQWDERWGYAIYGDNMIAINGCGPTALAMVAAGLTGDAGITPDRVARYAAEQGYYEGDAGTSWTLMTEGARQFGIYGEELGLDEGGIYSALESGHPIICSMKPGDFTTTGHFIVLTGIEDGRIRVNDPNSRIRSEKLWDYSTLEHQISNLWEFSLL